MDIIEIRNNLVKLSYGENESPQLGQFIALATNDKSYVAQYVNLKADNLNNFAVARLMFTFTPDGVVSEYDGSIPTTSCSLINLPSEELLDLLPVETPIKIGKLASQSTMLNIDISIFERNFTIFSNYDNEKNIIISNFVRQLFRLKEKSVIIDTDGLFSEYSSLNLGKDYKLPLNTNMIDYIFNYELKEVDKTTKAIVQDIFYAVSQYIKTLENQFIPIDNFIDVVAQQYKESQMPELALLKNKLLKYQESGIFANKSEDFEIIDKHLMQGNCTVFDLKNINGELQKEIIKYIHKKLEKIEKYIYFFVQLYDDNSDKKLVKQLITNSHVFTTFIAPHSYKYSGELKSHAQDILFFAPMDIQHDFAAYNTFLSKLNPQEAVICGGLTQGVPLIISVEDLELDLLKEDVFGEKHVFYPSFESSQTTQLTKKTTQGNSDLMPKDEENAIKELPVIEPLKYTEEVEQQPHNTIEPIENILSDDYESSKTTENNEEKSEEESEEETQQQDENEGLSVIYNGDDLTEEDLDFMEENQEDSESDSITENIDIDIDAEDGFDEDSVPIVPVYTPEENESEEVSGEDIGYSKGDTVSHPRYGNGVIEKIIKYGNKTLCSIAFENVGRRLLDPSISEFEKI